MAVGPISAVHSSLSAARFSSGEYTGPTFSVSVSTSSTNCALPGTLTFIAYSISWRTDGSAKTPRVSSRRYVSEAMMPSFSSGVSGGGGGGPLGLSFISRENAFFARP